MLHSAEPRRIAILAFSRAQLLDVIGPCEVFATASRLHESSVRPYSIEIIAPEHGLVDFSSGLSLHAARSCFSVRNSTHPDWPTPSPIDTLLVAGGIGWQEAVKRNDLIDWLRSMSPPSVRRLGSVCTGAFLLAEAGLLDNRKATTHWSWCRHMMERYPSISVEPDSIYVRDGMVYTSAGVTAGMDLALAMVEEDLGRESSLRVARQLVMFQKRPGGQRQFSSYLAAQMSEKSRVGAAQTWILEHLSENFSIAHLAEHIGMSPRNFSRVFTRETHTTPAKFVERCRV